MKSARDPSPTIYDVASQTGLSIATISRVLNSPERVRKSTRKKVLEAIDALGYVPRAEARARALRSTCRIGVITPYFTAPSFVQRLRGIASILAIPNYELIIYTVDSLERLRNYLSTLPLTGSLDGLIVMSLLIDPSDRQRLLDHKLQTVFIETHLDDFSTVEIDDLNGGKIAARHLIARGHRRLSFLGDINPPDYAIRPVIERYYGFRQGLAEAGIELPEQYVRSAACDQEQSRQAARELLDLPEPPSAIFAAADVQAIAILKVARDRGIKIPQELAVIGFDDLDMADFVGLTTVSQSLDDSGRIAAEILLARLSNPERPLQHVKLPLAIINRDTT